MFDKIETMSKLKQSESGSLEKKIEQMLDNERRLKDELEQVRSEREAKIFDYQNQLQKEREQFKLKLRESESKGTKREAKQTELMMSFEKEKVQWE